MNKTPLIGLMFCAAFLSCGGNKEVSQEPLQDGMKTVFADDFLIGAALNTGQVAGQDSMATQLVKKHLSSIVAENCMKCEVIHPQENVYDFSDADAFIDYGVKNNMAIIGHCLIWHSQCAPWFFVDEKGKQVSADVLKARMKEHITTLVSRYKGRVKGWDVVNEAILEDGSYRPSKFYEILGEEFIPLAFQYAHEADPNVELYYNDYGMDNVGRRNTVIQLIKDLKSRGLRIDAIGMQSHMGMDYPNLQNYETSMEAFAAEGVKVHITELDMSALPTINTGANVADKVDFQTRLNPYPDALPDSISKVWNDRMAQVFDIYLRHADVIERVTFWGVTDGDSWKNNWPMAGRTEYPLVFDRQYNLKPFMKDLVARKIADKKTNSNK